MVPLSKGLEVVGKVHNIIRNYIRITHTLQSNNNLFRSTPMRMDAKSATKEAGQFLADLLTAWETRQLAQHQARSQRSPLACSRETRCRFFLTVLCAMLSAPIVSGSDQWRTWRELITQEYCSVEDDAPMRQNWVPDVDATQSLVMESIEDYLDAICLPHTFMDEFMMMAVASMWEVRVAVFHYQDRQLTSANSQFVPGNPVEARRKIHLLQSGQSEASAWLTIQGVQMRTGYESYTTFGLCCQR